MLVISDEWPLYEYDVFLSTASLLMEKFRDNSIAYDLEVSGPPHNEEPVVAANNHHGKETDGRIVYENSPPLHPDPSSITSLSPS